MRMHQGKAEAFWLRARIIPILAVLIMLFGAVVTTQTIVGSAKADSITYSSLGYPWANAACATPDPKTGKCDSIAYDNWGYTKCPSNDTNCMALVLNGYGVYDPWNYYLRNCTGFVAWKLWSLGVNSKYFENLGDGGSWYTNAEKYGLVSVGTTPKVGAAAVAPGHDHVAYVSAVNSDGTITVQEYNHDEAGDGDTWTGQPSSRGFTEYVYFASRMTHPPNDFDIMATEPNGTNSVKYMIGYNNGTGLNYNWGGTNLTLNTAPTQMVIADLNGDGKADILATEPSSAPGCSNGVQYMVGLSNGDGTFNWHFTNLTCNTPPTTLAVGNVQGNNRMDIIATEPSCTGGVKYMIGYNDGTGLNYNWGGTNLTCNVPPTHMSVADVNNNGMADIIATEPSCSGGVRYMVGMSNGNGTFNWDFTNLTCDTAPTQMAVGNVLDSGRQEIIATEPSCSGGVKYMIGYNDGTGLNYNWGGTNLTCNTLPTHMVLGDMNNDGKADIIATEPSCPGGVHYMVGLSNGNGTFNWDSTNLTCNTAPDQIGVGKVQG